MKMTSSNPSTRRQAFTRTELVCVVGALSLLTTMIVRAVGAREPATERAVCANNLRLMGIGLASWTGDFQQRVPWRVPLSQGGTLPDQGTKPGNAWYEYWFLSNSLVTPKILACPADVGVKPATNFVQYATPGYRAVATSYHLNMEVFPEHPDAWVSGDRNMRNDGFGSSCSARSTGFYSFIAGPSTQAAWTNAVHGTNAGHLLLNDGSVQFTDSATLRNIVGRFDENGASHFLPAR